MGRPDGQASRFRVLARAGGQGRPHGLPSKVQPLGTHLVQARHIASAGLEPGQRTTLANPDHLAKLNEGVEAWNKWRDEKPGVKAYLNGADLDGANLIGANLSGADLIGAHLNDAKLNGADLSGTKLNGVKLNGADLSGAKLSGANLNGAGVRGPT